MDLVMPRTVCMCGALTPCNRHSKQTTRTAEQDTPGLKVGGAGPKRYHAHLTTTCITDTASWCNNCTTNRTRACCCAAIGPSHAGCTHCSFVSHLA